ncbi:197_t:CDS:1 [Paraglomus brasilianum]|uniref:Endoplasmic reticulum junction formation protein lunapark n=1 Tax=Paraglomus brasilianum TaxID=144538 RepID=A0A9N9A2V2_9GLOM|nr:197_t:CDS:1 [Paraglomus brasilianum]
MGPLLSLLRLKEKDDDNYEKILSELDEQISTSEVRLCDIKLRQKRSTIFWLAFSTVLYIAYVSGWYFFGWKSKYDETWQLWLLKLFPVFAFPCIIWMVKKFMSMWYRRKEANERSQLKHLVARKKLKIEELKKKTGYYATQNLIERFDVNNSQKSLAKSVNFPALPNEWSQNDAHFTDNSQVPATGLRLRLPTSTSETKDESSLTPPGYYNTTIPPSNTPLKRTWYDRVIDLLAGEEGPYKKYALICSNCHAHNGLVSQQDLNDVQYFCPKCNHFNPSRRSKRDETNGAVNSNNNTNNEDNGSSRRGKGVNKQSGSIRSPTPRRGRSTTPRPTTSSNEMMNNEITTDDYDDDGVAVSKRLASRSTSRRRRAGSHSQSRLEDSEEEGMRRYETSDEEYVSRRRIHE